MNNTSEGSFFGLLFLVFFLLKFTGVIAWSWWWVTAPLWVPVVFLVLFMVGFAVFGQKMGGK